VWFDRYILGKWTLAEGLVYPDFRQALTQYVPPKVSDYCISLDYGTSNPFAALFWTNANNRWYATDELYYSGRDSGIQKTDGQYLSMLEEFAERNIINRVYDLYGEEIKIPVIIDPSAASFIALLRRSKMFKPISANNDVLNGIRRVNTAIKLELIKVASNNKNWIREAQSYVWDEKAEEDRPVKEHDHLMDAMRYFVNTKRIVRPTDIEDYKSPFERRI
jgi:PBSX family phage terminase large subunit